MTAGYVRLLNSGPSLEEQLQVLTSSGVGAPVFIEGPPVGRAPLGFSVLDEAVDSLLEGHGLAVSDIAILGGSLQRIRDLLQALAGRKAFLLDASTGERYLGTPDELRIADLLLRAQQGATSAKMSKAREGRADAGHSPGAPMKLGPEALAAAQTDWSNLSISIGEIVRRSGVSERTLYRALGPRKRLGDVGKLGEMPW